MSADEILAGLIAAEHDPPGLNRDRWLALIGELASLVGDGEAAALIEVDGEARGRIAWSSRANELEVYGDVDEVQDAAWEVASALDARFVTLAELTRC